MSTAPPVCQTCLTTDRRLVPVLNIQKTLLEVHFSDLVANYGGLCWECNRMLLKFSTFKSQVAYAQRLLHTSNKSTKFQSLSPLKCETRRTYDLEYTEPEDPLTYNEKIICEPLVVIKEETACQHYQNDAYNVDEGSDYQNDTDLDPKMDSNDSEADQTRKKKKRLKKRESPNNSDSYNSDESNAKKKPVNKRRRSSADSDSISDDEFDKDLKSIKRRRKPSFDSNRDEELDNDLKTVKERQKPGAKSNSNSDEEFDKDLKTVKKRRKPKAHSNANSHKELDKDLKIVKKRQKPGAKSNSNSDEFEDSKTVKKRRKPSADSDSKSDVAFDKELKEKYEIVKFTEAEMHKNREEKRNGHNYKKIPYKCDLCVLGFIRKDTYDHHLIRKHDKKIGKHSCPVCMIYFPTLKAAQHHQTKHYTLYKCRLCKYEASELCFMENHCRAKHKGDRADSIHCQTCGAVCRSPEEMAAHTRTAHPLRCSQCGEVFKCKKTLGSHMRRIHASKREFTCGTCGRGCASRSRLETHAAAHGGVQALRLAYCALCRVQYKNIYVYRNHKHNSPAHAETAHECTVCRKKFASKVYWKRHIEFFHQKKSKFKCHDCSKLFMSAWSLRQHRQLHHGELRQRNYGCDLCSKKFFTSSTLKNHKLTHSEERRFMCAQCGDTFKQRPSLYTHCKLVHGRAGNTL